MTLHLSELFAGLQGEGPTARTAQVFVRFGGCPHRCAYCDTPEALVPPPVVHVRPGGEPDRRTHRTYANPRPLSWVVSQVLSLAEATDPPICWASLTGGEPLAQAEACGALSEALRPEGFHIHLETAGTLPGAMRRVRAGVDVVAMDLKFPSATGEAPMWDLHRAFLREAQGCRRIVKAVVVSGTPLAEWKEALSLLAGLGDGVELVIQPVTPSPGAGAPPTAEELGAWQALARRTVPRVTVSAQRHRMGEWPALMPRARAEAAVSQ
ncbi:MAG: radical SAM protein [Planctomycetes bacterium]|nr:radical SAM protein [Planctomycetota bacterium]